MPEAWVPDLGRISGAKYLAIADAMQAAIECGRLRAGDRLLPQRDLAARLGVDLTTVTKAYDQARGRGLIGARGRAGSFVLPQPTVAAGPPPRDTGMNMPPEVPGGSLPAIWERTASALLRAEGAGGRLHYTPAGGRAADREAGAALFARLGLASEPDQLIVAAGAQNALHAIVAATLKPGDVVACGAHVYSVFLALARRFGLRLAPLARVDADSLDMLCRTTRVAALYLVPTNDNPTTRTLDLAEREALAGALRRHDVRLIEDDAYGQLPDRPLAPVTSFVPELGFYVASVSKILSPALRVAHVRAPGVRDALALAGEVHMSTVMAPPLDSALVTRWIEDGSYARLAAETRAEAKARQAIAASVLPAGSYAAHEGGYHLWVPLPPPLDRGQVAAALRAEGLTAIPSDMFAAGDSDASALRVSLGGAIDRAGLTRGLTALEMQLSAGGCGVGVI